MEGNTIMENQFNTTGKLKEQKRQENLRERTNKASRTRFLMDSDSSSTSDASSTSASARRSTSSEGDTYSSRPQQPTNDTNPYQETVITDTDGNTTYNFKIGDINNNSGILAPFLNLSGTGNVTVIKETPYGQSVSISSGDRGQSQRRQTNKQSERQYSLADDSDDETGSDDGSWRAESSDRYAIHRDVPQPKQQDQTQLDEVLAKVANWAGKEYWTKDTLGIRTEFRLNSRYKWTPDREVRIQWLKDQFDGKRQETALEIQKTALEIQSECDLSGISDIATQKMEQTQKDIDSTLKKVEWNDGAVDYANQCCEPYKQQFQEKLKAIQEQIPQEEQDTKGVWLKQVGQWVVKYMQSILSKVYEELGAERCKTLEDVEKFVKDQALKVQRTLHSQIEQVTGISLEALEEQAPQRVENLNQQADELQNKVWPNILREMGKQVHREDISEKVQDARYKTKSEIETNVYKQITNVEYAQELANKNPSLQNIGTFEQNVDELAAMLTGDKLKEYLQEIENSVPKVTSSNKFKNTQIRSSSYIGGIERNTGIIVDSPQIFNDKTPDQTYTSPSGASIKIRRNKKKDNQ
jgi:hypothetical protein